MTDIAAVYKARTDFSTGRLKELRSRIAKLSAVADYSGLTIFGAGSYARYEASEYSDIDLFFVCSEDRADVQEPRTRELRLFGQLIELVDTMDFKKFSNDCQYLRVLHNADILSHLGSPDDDHENYFTVRMLLLLESKCIFGDENYHGIIRNIVSSYFKDFLDHARTFQPIFLMNDICRFWKTLLLNYEHKRGSSDNADDKAKQKVKNFKLKFSRMTTCFATIAALGSYLAPVTEEQVLEQTRMTPRERLQDVVVRVPQVKAEVTDVLDRYAWFLDMTGLPAEELRGHFKDKQQRSNMFKLANEYGDSMFNLLKVLDGANDGKVNLLRYVVI